MVGIVDSARALALAGCLPRGAVDFLEWRADCFPPTTPLPRSRFPWIVTARHPAEGGCRALSAPARRDLLLRLLAGSSGVDVEARSLRPMLPVLKAAKKSGRLLIISFHDFHATPQLKKLRDVIRRGTDAGADIVKIAVTTNMPKDIALLLDLFPSPVPLALMGMGRLGMASRPLMASCGSVLNYGWLHRPNVPGQWAAAELKSLLARMTSRQK